MRQAVFSETIYLFFYDTGIGGELLDCLWGKEGHPYFLNEISLYTVIHLIELSNISLKYFFLFRMPAGI